MQASGSSAASAQKAGWWARFFALFLDGLIIVIPGAIIIGLIIAVLGKSGGGIAVLLYVLWLISYPVDLIYFWTKDGQTLGNKALNIRVVKTDGSKLSVGAGVVRYIGMLVNSIIFGLPIGYIWAAFDAEKQGWHDKMAGTYVVKAS